MIKRLLKYILVSFVASVSTYVVINNYTVEKSILIGRPVDVVFMLSSVQNIDNQYIEYNENNNLVNTMKESDCITSEDKEMINEKSDVQKTDVVEMKETTSTASKTTEKSFENQKEIDFELTFYTNLDCENGYGAITSTGEALANKMLLASNVYDIGTKIYLDGYGVLEVKDKGGSEMNLSNRLDVYLPRKEDESDAEYKNRALQYGRQTVKGYIIN